MTFKIVLTVTNNNSNYEYSEEQKNTLNIYNQYLDSILSSFGGSKVYVAQSVVFSFSAESDARAFINQIYDESNSTILNYLTMRRNISIQTGNKNSLKYHLYNDNQFLETIKSVN